MKVVFANLQALVGLGALGRGLWMVSPALAFCVLGSLLLIAGVIARSRC